MTSRHQSPISSTLDDIVFEAQRPKAEGRHWEVSNVQTDRAYGIHPGTNDGTADAYGVGDLWVLRYQGPTEIDDAVQVFDADTSAHISKWVNAESVSDADIVVWYGAHFLHDEQHDHGNHVVGPTMKPIRW